MYPNLLVPLVSLTVMLLAGIGFVALRQPVSRRLAMRQLARRRSEAALAVIGSVLGTAIIAGALVVGDTLNFSVRQDAYRTLGPVDERVLAADPATGDRVATKLDSLRYSPDVDGVLSAHLVQASASAGAGAARVAEPRVFVWGLDLIAAASFGSAGGPSGLGGPSYGPNAVVLNQALADSLHVQAGGTITLYLFGTPRLVTVARVVPVRGLAGVGLGASTNRNAFIEPGALDLAAQEAHAQPQAVTFVSNRGGVERGAALTDTVTAQVKTLLGPTANGVLVDTPKRNVLNAARAVGDSLGSLFLMIGSFSIIAGALLLVNIFVMLADERKGQLGMLRAVGMRRSRLIGSLTLEGSSYALISIVPGLLLGLGVGWGVARIAALIFRSFSASGTGLDISFAVTPTSLVNAGALGLIIGILTILITSLRISRFNVIAAIRDLPSPENRRARRLILIGGTALAALLAVASVPAIASSQAEGTYLYPALAAVCALPLVRRRMSSRWAVTATAAAILVWTLLAPLVRPHLFDQASMAVYVIEGTLVAFSAVALVSRNQDAVLRPLRALFRRSAENALAFRLAVAYPVAKRGRTGATLSMYALISLVLVLLVEVAGVINASIDRNVADATAGYAMRLDFNPSSAGRTLAGVRDARFSDRIGGVTPLLTATAYASDPGHRTKEPLRVQAVGVPAASMDAMRFTDRLTGYSSDAAIWHLLASDPRYVVLDQFLGQTGGPNGNYYSPGDTFQLTDPRTGHTATKTIAGILSNALIFYPVGGSAADAYPIVTSTAALSAQFGPDAAETAALVRTRAGVSPERLAGSLQATFLADSLVATPVASSVRRMFAANISFFRLMQGFLALGLVVGIVGLGVVMVRAVRERRRTIGVLRALGVRARTVQRSFLMESAIIAVEGIGLGAVFGVLTTWLMYQKSAMFEGVRVAFPVEWATIAVLCGATVVASLAASVAPARRAARTLPAVAVRVAD